MKIMVPLTMAPDTVEDLEVDSSGTRLDPECITLKLNEFDDHALEEALLLKESDGAQVVAVAIAGEAVDKQLYTALAKGADQAVRLTGAASEGGNRTLGAVFAEAAKQLGADLVLAGVQSVADVDGQVGPVIAARLDAPFISVVTGVTAIGSGIEVRKEYAGGLTADFEVTLPAVLGIQAARKPPRYAPVSKVRQIQQSATLDELAITAPEDTITPTITAMAPPERGAGAKMLANTSELVAVLKEKGVL